MRPEITDPKLIALYDYWDGKRRDRPFPARADLDPLEMKPWLGNLLLIHRSADRYQYRLYGTQFVAQFGVELTGHSVDELPDDHARMLRDEYAAVCREGLPRARRYTAMFDLFAANVRQPGQTRMTWERLVLPLSLDAPDQVGLLLVGAYASR